ncbi:phosphoribosylglycinamide formyltransferase [Oceanobacillus saliphilus]|uniref:phosphoribosylglycinamide formyltransferase n=1 Tax=Oceanobacillus saliphilus TaxID=2925834 RepID=UPI00201DB34A|nr:phosphoribosylglycinamide formyltransferase [Oceanobacillus saliphilus]
MSKVKAAVFASGSGSNFQAIMETNDLACDVVLLVCDKPGAGVLEKAKKYGVPSFVFEPKQFASKAEYEKLIVQKLQESGVTWVFLAGYMRIAGPTLLEAYEGKIVNIHPSLLPDFPGIDAIGQAFKANVDVTGVTVHFIDAGIDTGPIIAQEPVDILKEDTETSLKERIQKVEHELYPRVINQLLQ